MACYKKRRKNTKTKKINPNTIIQRASFRLSNRNAPHIIEKKLKTPITIAINSPVFTTIPPSTIPAWAAMMTSKNPGKLGFSQFVVRTEDGYRWKFPTLNWEDWNPIWNMLSRHKKRVCVLNVPTSRAPRSDFNGVFVSGMFMSDESDFSVYPAELSQSLLGQGYRIHIPEFDPRKPREFLDNLIANTRTKNRVALEMYSRERWDLFTFVYFYTDPLFHFFWKYFDQTHGHYEKHDEIE